MNLATQKSKKCIMLRFICLLCLVGLSAVYTQAQVRIGSGHSPRVGALLDLSEKDDTTSKSGGVNAQRGLLLPRVALQDVESLLPLRTGKDPQYTGVVVYNTIEIGGKLCIGLYMWSDTKWIPLTPCEYNATKRNHFLADNKELVETDK